LVDSSSNKALSILDVGSSLGYLSNFIADNTIHNVKGIDFDYKNNWISNLVSMNLRIGAQFQTAKLTKEYVDDLLPQHDIVFYFSVLHHINNEYGTNYVKDLIVSTVNKSPYLLLELAHKGEDVEFSWRSALPEDITSYFDHLPSGGFDLHFLGDFPTHLSNIDRPLYLLERKYITVNDTTYYYNKTNFAAHTGVHQDRYSTIHRYYQSQDNEYFIKECLELGSTENLQQILSTHIQYFYKKDVAIVGTPQLLDYQLA
jgi:hypothetical protein